MKQLIIQSSYHLHHLTFADDEIAEVAYAEALAAFDQGRAALIAYPGGVFHSRVEGVSFFDPGIGFDHVVAIKKWNDVHNERLEEATKKNAGFGE